MSPANAGSPPPGASRLLARGIGRSQSTRSEPIAVTLNVWGLLQSTRWSLGLVGLLAYMFAVVTYRLPIGTASATIAIVGALLVLQTAKVPRAFLALGAFLLWAFVSALASPWVSVSVDAALEFGKVILVTIAASIILVGSRNALLAMGWFVLCFVLFPIRGAIIGGDTLVGRMVWNYIYANPNDLAVLTLLAMGITLALAQLRWRQKYLRPLLYTAVALELWVILRTQSRGAALGLVAVAIAALVNATPRLRRKLLVRGSLALILAVPFIPKETINRYVGGTFATEVELDREQRIAYSSREEREHINAASIRIALGNSLIGVGFGAYPKALAQAVPELGAKDTHNTYLNVWCETGLPGLALLLTFLGLSFQEVRRALQASKARRADHHQALLLFSSSVGGFWVAALFGSYVKLVPPMIVMVLLISYARLVARESVPATGRA